MASVDNLCSEKCAFCSLTCIGTFRHILVVAEENEKLLKKVLLELKSPTTPPDSSSYRTCDDCRQKIITSYNIPESCFKVMHSTGEVDIKVEPELQLDGEASHSEGKANKPAAAEPMVRINAEHGKLIDSGGEDAPQEQSDEVADGEQEASGADAPKKKGRSTQIRYRCQYCGKGFVHKSILDNHVRWHTVSAATSKNNYSVVQIQDGTETLLSTLPSKWVVEKGWNEGSPDDTVQLIEEDLCYWPKGPAGYRLLERAKLDPNIEVNSKLLQVYRCEIMASNFPTYAEAFCAQTSMELNADADEYEPRLKNSKISDSAADQSEPPSFPINNSKTNGTAPSNANSPKCSWSRVKPVIEAMQSQVNTCLSLLSQMDAKIDALSPIVPVKPSSKKSTVTVDMKNMLLTPVKNLTDLESLEVRSADDRFVKTVVSSLGMLHGKSCWHGRGSTVCLQIIDYFFDREFMLRCSWTGIVRNKNADGEKVSKIPFQKYDNVIRLFYRVVLNSDPSFTFDDCLKFLHRCVRNAKQRFEEVKGIRKSVARNRRRMKKKSQHTDGVEANLAVMEELLDSSVLCKVEYLETSEVDAVQTM